MNRDGVPWAYAPLLVVLLGAYLGVAYVTFATQGFYSASLFFLFHLPTHSNSHLTHTLTHTLSLTLSLTPLQPQQPTPS